MDLQSHGTKLSKQGLLAFLFDSAALLRQQLEGLLVDAVIASPRGQPRKRTDAAEEVGKERHPQTDSDKPGVQTAEQVPREDHNLVGSRDRELHAIELEIEELRYSLATTRLELAEARNRAEDADRAARKAMEDSARLQKRGLLGRWLRRV